jgi:diaminopimelate decarboxylase
MASCIVKVLIFQVLEEKHGTPSYIYSKKTIEENAKAYVNSFTNTRNLACFAG